MNELEREMVLRLFGNAQRLSQRSERPSWIDDGAPATKKPVAHSEDDKQYVELLAEKDRVEQGKRGVS